MFRPTSGHSPRFPQDLRLKHSPGMAMSPLMSLMSLSVAGTPTSVMEERLQTRHIRHPSALVLVGRIMTLDEPALMTFLVDH